MSKDKFGLKKFFLNLLFGLTLLWSGVAITGLFKDIISFVKDFDEEMIALWFVWLPVMLIIIINTVIPILITIFLWKKITKLDVETNSINNHKI